MSNPDSDDNTTTGGIPTQSEIAQIRAARDAEAKLVDQITDAYESGQLTAGRFEAVLRDIVLTKLPAGYTLGPCPPWCATDHAAMDDFERTEGWRQHSSEPVKIPAVNSGTSGTPEARRGPDAGATQREAWVDVSAMDILDTGVRQPAAVNVWLGDYLTPANARLLAEAIVAAAKMADEWNAR